MENSDWANWAAAGLALAIAIGGLLMMFTNLFTDSRRR